MLIENNASNNNNKHNKLEQLNVGTYAHKKFSVL